MDFALKAVGHLLATAAMMAGSPVPLSFGWLPGK